MGMPIIQPSNISRCQSITDIIQSVALEQAALAHILNAEGEKIQKIVALSDSPQEMLMVNKSVNDIVNSVSMLEIVLKSKLALFEDCLCEECPCAAITDISLSFINLADTGDEIIKNNKNSYSVLIGNCNELPVSMLFAATPAAFVRAVSLPPSVTFQNSIITVNCMLTDSGTVVLEVGEGSCRQTVTIDIRISCECD